MADKPVRVKAYGKIHNFPAGTTPEAIESALAEHRSLFDPDDFGGGSYETPQPEALDYAKGFASGANKLVSGVGFLMEAAGAKETGKAVRAFGDRGAKYWNDKMSKGGKLASESQVFVDDDNEDSVTGIKLSDDWGKALLMGASQSLPSMFAAAIPGVAVTKGIQALAKLGLAGGAGATIPLLAGTAAPVGVTSNIIARVPSAVGFGAAEGVTAGAMNAADFKTSIEGMTDEELNKSPVYRALKEEHDPATARSLLAEQAALDLFGKTAVSTGTIGALTGGGALSQAYQKVTTGAQSGLLGTMLKGAGTEALQETPQSGGEKFIENLTTQKFLNPDQNTTEGVLAAAASGGAIGAFTGGVVGAGGAINITPDRRSQLLNEKRKVAEMKADAVNNRTMEESAAQIGAAQDIDQALAAATRATTKPVVSANEVLRSEDPTLADIEKLTGLKPTEAIDTAIAEIENPIINQPQETEDVSNQEERQAATTQASVLGKTSELVLPDGASLPVQWEVVDADNVKASLKEGVNQPRDRTRAASDVQIKSIANNPDYRRLSDSPVMDVGSPVISYDGAIVAGNGRFEGVSQAHSQNTGGTYLESLKADLVNKGIDPALVEGMKKPILVRRITKPFDTRKLALASNSGASLQYSGLELAKIDADRMAGIEDIDIADNGDIPLTVPNIEKIKKSLTNYTPSEMASLVDDAGNLSQDGVKRVRGAILAKAYGNSPTLGRLIESTDTDIRNVLGALTRSAGDVAKVREEIKKGVIPKEVDVTENLLQAVEVLSQIRGKGQSLDQYLAQEDIFGEGIDPDSAEVLKFLHDNIRSQKRMAEFVKDVFGQIARIDQSTEDIFGGNNTPTKKELLNDAKRKSEEQQTGQQQGLFVKGSGRPDAKESKTEADNTKSSKGPAKPSFSVEGLTDKSPVMNEETFKAKGIAEPYSAYLKAHPNKSEAIKADIKHVENKLVQGLQSTGKFDDKTNQAYAAPFREFYKVNAERQGIMPSELYERLPLKFKGSQDTGEVLKQEGIDLANTPGIKEFKKGDTTVSYGNEGGVLKIYSMRTPIAKRGKGSARAAMESLIAQADKEGKAIILDSSPLDKRTKDRRLFEFYTSLGFKPTGKKINPVGDPEMRREPSVSSVSKKTSTNNTGEFDPNDPNILKQRDRAGFNPRTFTISLMDGSDLSSVIHEGGHFYLEALAEMASQPNAPKQIVNDFDTTLQWFGVEKDAWQSMPLEQKRPYHEQWAQSFERYALEGKAPSKEMQSVFDRFQEWMLDVYKSLKEFLKQNPLAGKLNDEVRGVFDRLLATEQDIAKSREAPTKERSLKNGERAKQLERKLREQGYDFTITAKDVRDFAAGDRGKEIEANTAEKIAGIFGRKIVWIDAQGDYDINGVVVPSIKDTIFIDVNTDKAAHAVMGHELSHHLEHDNPDVYDDLLDALSTVIKDHQGYAKKYGIEGVRKDDITKEIVGDIMGDNFTRPEFWNRVAEANPSTFKSIADSIINWLKNLILKAKSRGLGSDQWVTDSQKAQDILAKAIAKYEGLNDSVAEDGAKFTIEPGNNRQSLIEGRRLVEESFKLQEDIEGLIDQKGIDAGTMVESFSALIDRKLEINKELAQLLEEGKINGIGVTDKYLLSRNTTSDNPWRITYFQDNGDASGHSEYTSAANALKDIPFNTAKDKANLAMFHKVWHGSPHDHSKFDSTKIGTGEGAQAYGYGHYFADRREVAEYYKEQLSDNTNGPPERFFRGAKLTPGTPEYHAATLLSRNNISTLKQARNEVANWIAEDAGDPRMSDVVEGWRATLDFLNKANSKKDFTEKPYRGKLYEVELAPEQEDYLLWDKPLSEQSEKVKESIKALGIGSDKSPDEMNDLELKGALGGFENTLGKGEATGAKLYKEISSHFGGDKQASDYLHSIGIRGIKYLDGTSRSKGEGAYNYVVFDDKDIEITAKFSRRDSGDLEAFSRITLGAIRDFGFADSINDDGSVTVYHGTSKANAKGILKSGKFKGYPYFALEEKVAKRFGQTADRSGRGVEVLTVRVDPAYVLPVGDKYLTARIEGIEQDRDGVWRVIDVAESSRSDDVRFSKKAVELKDRQYLEAVESGDLESAQKMVDTAAREKGYMSGADYRMMHQAPNREDYNLATIKESGIVPKDYWTHPHYYQSDATERESFRLVNEAIDRIGRFKEKGIKRQSSMFVYRSVPKNVKDTSLRNGDWVSPSREYAKLEGEAIPEGYRIIVKRVPIKDLWWDANSINELGYDDGKEYAYKNTKNNRKLIDPVTYDDDGNVIPLSKRFNSRSDDVRFSKKAAENTLIVQHNLTVKNLLHADRMGGLAAPSIAVTDKSHPLTGFGEITLLADKDLIDPQKGAKIFGSDIYSPRYPQLSYDFTGKPIEKLKEMLADGIAKTGDSGFYNDNLERDPFNELLHNSAAMHQFLIEQGKKSKIVYVKPKPLSDPDLKPFLAFKGDSFDLSKDEKFRAVVKNIFEAKKDYEIDADGLGNMSRVYAEEVMRHRDAKKNTGKVDHQATNSSLFRQIGDAKLMNKFENYLVEVINKAEPKERIFQGYTNSGNRRYLPHDIDTVVKLLQKDLRGGENFKYGLGSVRAKYSKQFKSIEQIRNSKNSLMSSEDFDAVKKEVNAELDTLSEALNKYGTFSGFDNVENMLSDAAKLGINRALKENGFENVPDRLKIDAQNFLNKLKDMPTEYFEAKLLRRVDLGEFTAAVVPKDTPAAVLEILKKNGVTDIRKYKSGDKDDRIAQIGKLDRVMFSRKEKGEELLAPNGKKSNLDAKQWNQVRTPEFKKWFGDWEAAHNGQDGNGVWAKDDVSKVVDENGEPLVVYHGSQKGGFTIFKPERAEAQRSPMIFAAKTRGTASTYAGTSSDIVFEEPVLPVTEEDFENLGYSFEEQDDGRYYVYFEGYPYARNIATLTEAMEYTREGIADEAVRDVEEQSGVYPIFLNIRNPLESDFRGANWDGDRAGSDQYSIWDSQEQEFVNYSDSEPLSRGDADELYEFLGGDDVEFDGRPRYDIQEAPMLYETTNSVAEEAKEYGNDGAIIRSVIDDGGRGYGADVDDVFVIFDANQIKSATDNTGEFSLENDDIRFSKKPEPFDPNTDIPETLPRKAQRLTQDAFNRFTVIQNWLKKKGVTLSEKADVYQAEERYHSLVANQLEDFREQKRNPLIEKIAKAGFTMADVSDFLEAQHAAEANAAIQKISNNDTDTAYGITDKEAADYLAKADPKLATLANELRDITEESKQMRLKAGLLSQEEVDAWESTYEHYIPVKGDADAKGGTGKGLKVNFKTKRRLGHGRRDESVIENIFLDHERAIMQVEKNRVAKHLVMMAAEMQMPEIMTVGQPVKRKTLRNTTAYEVKVSGVTRSVFNNKQAADMFKQLLPSLDKGVSPNDVTVEQTKDQRIVAMASPMLAENEINAYIDGHAIRVQINDDLLARAYAKLGVTGFSALVSAGRAFNGYLSKVYTGYNPEFILTNMIRDFTSGLINLTGEEGIKMAAKTSGNYVKSFSSLMRYAVSNGKKSDKWIDMYRANGGNTGAAYLSDLERLGDEVKTEYAAYQGVMANLKSGSFANATRAAGRKVFNLTLKWIYNLNQAGENAMRLAAFRAMIESGKTPAQAAKAAKNITVNFNRKGELGAEANAAYLFFNASVQGVAALAHAHFKGEHKYQAWGLSSMVGVLGYMAAAALLGGDDDEYDKLNDYTKSRNLLIKAGEGYAQIPIPYGYGFFWNMGRSIAEAQHKGELGNLPWHIAASAIEELTPFSDTVVGTQDGFHFDQVMLGLLPTVIKIPAQPAFNKQLFSGSELMPDSAFQQFQPDREKLWRATQGTMYDRMSGWLDEAIGADVSPETLKHYTRTFTGGAGAMVDATVSAAMLKKEGAELEPSEIPFVRKAYSKLTIREHRAAYYKAREEAKKTAEEFTRAKARNDITTINKLVKDEAEMIGLDAYANKLSKAISAMRDMQDAIRLDDNLNAAEKRTKIKELEITEQKFYDQYLDVFKIEKAKMKARGD